MPLGARQTRHTMTVLSFSIPRFPRWLETLQWLFFLFSVEYLNLEVSDTLKLSVSTPLVLCPSVETFLLQYKVEKVRPQSKCDSDSCYQSWRVCGHHTLSLCLVFCRSSQVWKYLSPVLFLARGALTGVPPKITPISTQNAWSFYSVYICIHTIFLSRHLCFHSAHMPSPFPSFFLDYVCHIHAAGSCSISSLVIVWGQSILKIVLRH